MSDYLTSLDGAKDYWIACVTRGSDTKKLTMDSVLAAQDASDEAYNGADGWFSDSCEAFWTSLDEWNKNSLTDVNSREYFDKIIGAVLEELYKNNEIDTESSYVEQAKQDIVDAASSVNEKITDTVSGAVETDWGSVAIGAIVTTVGAVVLAPVIVATPVGLGIVAAVGGFAGSKLSDLKKKLLG